MKRFFPILMASLFLTGCGDAPSKKQSKGSEPAKETPAVAQAPEKKDAKLPQTSPKKADEPCCEDDGKSPAKSSPDKIALTPIKLKDLLKTIADQKDKIVIVDLWGTFCIPCKEEFPNLIRMHHTYGKDGVVCMSLSLDDPDDKAEALKFLKEKKAVIRNYWLEEGVDAAQKQWDFEPVPVCLIYGRDGKLEKTFKYSTTENFTYKDVEKLVKSMIESKAEPKKAAATKFDLTPVTMKELLGKHVPAHKGKVVVLDVWGTFCPPCVAEFPKLVTLNNNYQGKGVVCLSMSLDEDEELPKAKVFLEKHKADFTHYWLPEGFDGLRKTWKFDAIPLVVVFGRDGQVVNIFRDTKFSYADVETLIKKLLES